MPAARPWRRGLMWLVLLAPLFYASYGLANHVAAARASVPSIVFDWERSIPFWDWSIFPYWSINVLYALSLVLARSRHELDRHAARLLTAQLVAVACFVAWPLRFSSGAPEAHGASAWLFAALRSFDQPFNQAPSLHIALAVVLWDFYRRIVSGRLARAAASAWTLAICASVLTTYQHHFIDIPTGALLGVLCAWAWPLERRVSMARAWMLTRDRRRLVLAARYAGGSAVLAGLAFVLGGTALWLLWPGASLVLVALNYAGFGARGFQMNSRGRMTWAARALLAPYRLGATLNAALWLRGTTCLREVLPGISVGGLPRVPRGRPGSVVSLCAELQVPPQSEGRAQRSRCLPWLDLVAASPAALRRASGLIERAVRCGEPVVVACALGFSRSVAALACWMVRSGHARDADDAIEQLRHAHPDLVLGQAWRHALRIASATPGGTGR